MKTLTRYHRFQITEFPCDTFRRDPEILRRWPVQARIIAFAMRYAAPRLRKMVHVLEAEYDAANPHKYNYPTKNFLLQQAAARREIPQDRLVVVDKRGAEI